jgi:molybdopterin-guanine dinucleotide biosynthesis protein A
MTDEPRAVGAVLAGGRSRRMGTAKALVELAGRPLISHPLAAVADASLEPVVVAKPESPLPELVCRVVREPAEPAHPLRGIVSALEESRGRAVIALACDMPLVPPALLEWLAGLDGGVVVPRVGERLQPLLARYEPAVAGALGDALERDAAVHEAVVALEPRVVAEDELARFGDPELISLNVNTPADLERAEAALGRV